MVFATLAAVVCGGVSAGLRAHPLSFNSTITYAQTQPSGAPGSVANWTGGAYDAANLSAPGADNDTLTVVAHNRPARGQTFTTGGNAQGYELTGLTVRLPGYTRETTGTTRWNLKAMNGPMLVTIGKVSGTSRSLLSIQAFTAGGTGHPGEGSSASGPGAYLTFNLPFPVHLEPNTTYGFDFVIGKGSANHFEWLGTSANAYAGGAAYTRDGDTLTLLGGDRVFMANLTASKGAAGFAHPGTLHTRADLERMKAKIAAGAEPWKSSFDALTRSPFAQTGWPAYNIDTIVRGVPGNNYTRTQRDAQAIYQLALRWHLTGDTAYADKAVQIANVWSDLKGVTGNTNSSLAAGICGYLFAIGGELLSTYPGWPDAERQAYQAMMMRVFYPANFDFLWRHHGTPESKGGNTHYRLNWDTANMASMAAIGILCDNRAVYQQAVDYFKAGPGNGNARRAAWYIHPDGTAQTEESGRDQPHNLGGWYAMALLCQMAWNQGDDLFGYDNNRVLRAYEYNAKYNLGHDVPWVHHRNASITYTETLSPAGRGIGAYPAYELIYHHYACVKGVDAPWSQLAMQAIRPEVVTGPGGHPSGQDCLGLGSLTYARDDRIASAPPGGLVAHWSKQQVGLFWWGSAGATGYEIKRATRSDGPYTTLGTARAPELNFTDTTVVDGATYFYRITALMPSGTLDSAPLEVVQRLVAHYALDGSASDAVGNRHATLQGGMTAPGFAAGVGGGQAVALNGVDQYVQLPAGSGNTQDITLAAWVYWNGGRDWQRIFDFGSEIEKSLFLTPSGGGKLQFSISTSRGADGTGTLTGPALPIGQWVHVAVTLNGDTGTLYVNGVPVDAQVIDQVDPLFAQPFCYLGRSLWNGDPLFDGRIDDFRIYNYALSGGDVYALWGQGGTNRAPAFAVDLLRKAPATEGAGYSGQTLAGAATDADGGALRYARVSGPDWLVVAGDGALSGTPANEHVGDNIFVVRVTDPSGATDDATLRIAVANTNSAPDWKAATLAKPGVRREQPYAGSSLAADASDGDAGDAIVFTKVSGPAWLVVGADGALSGTPGPADVGANTFVVRATDRAGAASEVQLTITVQPLQLCAQLGFDNNLDDTQGSFPGTASGSPVYGVGRVGRSLVFDAKDDYVTLPAGIADLREFTISAWVYWKGGREFQRIFDFGNGPGQYLYLSPNGGGGLRFAIKNGGDEQQVNAPKLPTDQWVHVAVTLAGDTATLYVNGAVAGTSSGITVHPSDFKPAQNLLGKSRFGHDPLFHGAIDDFRVYNHALRPTRPIPAAAP